MSLTRWRKLPPDTNGERGWEEPCDLHKVRAGRPVQCLLVPGLEEPLVTELPQVLWQSAQCVQRGLGKPPRGNLLHTLAFPLPFSGNMDQ